MAARLIELEALLPGVDLSRLAARYPALLLEHTAAGVAAQLDSLRWVKQGPVEYLGKRPVISSSICEGHCSWSTQPLVCLSGWTVPGGALHL